MRCLNSRLSPNHSDFAHIAEMLIYFVHPVGRKPIPSIKRVRPRIIVQHPQGRRSTTEGNVKELLAKPRPVVRGKQIDAAQLKIPTRLFFTRRTCGGETYDATFPLGHPQLAEVLIQNAGPHPGT